jgi:hypothetical protein
MPSEALAKGAGRFYVYPSKVTENPDQAMRLQTSAYGALVFE